MCIYKVKKTCIVVGGETIVILSNGIKLSTKNGVSFEPIDKNDNRTYQPCFDSETMVLTHFMIVGGITLA